MDGVTLLRHAECLRREISDACTPPFFRRSRRDNMPAGSSIPAAGDDDTNIFPACAGIAAGPGVEAKKTSKQHAPLQGASAAAGAATARIKSYQNAENTAVCRRRTIKISISYDLYTIVCLQSDFVKWQGLFFSVCYDLFSFCSGKCPALTNPPVKAYNLW